METDVDIPRENSTPHGQITEVNNSEPEKTVKGLEEGIESLIRGIRKKA